MCMVAPTRPSSTTGQSARMKRASEMPPVVQSSGSRPATSRTAPAQISTKSPGSVMKAFPVSFVRSETAPANASSALAAHSACSQAASPAPS